MKLALHYFSRGMRGLSRAILVIAVFFTVINLFAYLTYKDKSSLPTYDEQIKSQRVEIYKFINNPKFNNSQGKQIVAVYRITMCRLVGEACTNNPNDADKNYPDSLMGNAAKVFTAPFMAPPASGIYYVATMLDSAGFVPKSYAAEGIGFAGLRPLLEIWRKIRNLAFLILVLIVMTAGFMIMFRMQLNAQTVIGIESALPRIIITLLLITFSFAIAGFLIDLMYIVMALLITTIGPIANPSFSIDQLLGKYLQAGTDDIPALLSGVNSAPSFWFNSVDIFFKIPNALLSIFGTTFNVIFRTIGIGLGMYLFHDRLATFWEKNVAHLFDAEWAPAGTATPLIGFNLAGLIQTLFHNMGERLSIFLIVVLAGVFLVPLIIGLLIFFTLIVLCFRILFLLITSYIKILLLVILSPFILMFEALPGRNAFSFWLRSMFAELMTFPLMIGIFLIGLIIFETSSHGTLIKFPFLYRINSVAFSVIIGMGFLFSMPKIIKAVKQIIAPQQFPLDIGPGVFFSGAGAAAGTALQKATTFGPLAFANVRLANILKSENSIIGKIAKGLFPHQTQKPS